MSIIRERKHRLSEELYRDNCRASFTACVDGRRRLFITPEVFTIVAEILIDACLHHNCQADVYLFMPDHAHIVLSTSAGGNVASTMKRFKQRSGLWLSQQGRALRWQKDFHDRVIRSDREYESKIRYILGNPVRAGLVSSWRDYPYKGSTVYDFDSWEVDAL